MKKSRLLGELCVVIASLWLASTANANLLGDTITCDADSPKAFTCTPSPAVVGSGVEFTIGYMGEDHFFVDVIDSAVKITASPLAHPGIGWGFNLSGLDWNGTGNLIGFKNFFSNVGPLIPPDLRFPTGVIASDILISPHSVHFDLSTSTWEPGDYVSFDLIGVSSVPIPPSAWLLGSGLLGLVGVARKKSA